MAVGHNLAKVSDKDEGRVRLEVESIHCHPFYSRYAPSDFDICLIEVKKNLNLKDRGQDTAFTPICIPKPEDTATDFTGKSATGKS